MISVESVGVAADGRHPVLRIAVLMNDINKTIFRRLEENTDEKIVTKSMWSHLRNHDYDNIITTFSSLKKIYDDTTDHVKICKHETEHPINYTTKIKGKKIRENFKSTKTDIMN